MRTLNVIGDLLTILIALAHLIVVFYIIREELKERRKRRGRN